MAVGHPVGADDPNADLGAGLGDDVETALDRVRTLVVVDDPGRPRQQGLQRTESCRCPQHVEVESGVEPPPDLLKDLAKPVGVLGGGGIPRASAE